MESPYGGGFVNWTMKYLHLIRHAARDTFSRWRRLCRGGGGLVKWDAGPYEVDVVLLNKCGKFVGAIYESTASGA